MRDLVFMRRSIPSHLASSSVVIKSSLGGSSWTGTLGAKRPESVPVIVTVDGYLDIELGQRKSWAELEKEGNCIILMGS